jgi:hypothetical protein
LTVDVTRVDGRTWQLAFAATAPPARAFDLVLDFPRHGEWELALMETRLLSGRAGEVGARYVKSYGQPPAGFFARLFWKPDLVDCVITAVDRGRRIVWQQDPRLSEDSDAAQLFDFRVEPQGHGCRVLLRRQFAAAEADGVDRVAAARARHQRPLNALPRAARQMFFEKIAAGSGISVDEVTAGFSATDEEAIGRMLDDVAARGPGMAALERLQALLEGRG